MISINVVCVSLLIIATMSLWRLINKHSQSALLAAIILLGSLQTLSAANYDEMGRGLLPMTAEQLRDLEENGLHVVGVRPNKIGLARIQQHRKEHGKDPLMINAASHLEEFVVVKGLHQAMASANASTLESSELPTSVNNSTLPSFPPIGNQGGLGSCACWAVTYYQNTHEYGLLNGINNKVSTSAVIFSPKWSYNFLNFGKNDGSFMVAAHNLVASSGAATMVQFPYDNNYLAWDLKTDDWVSALSRRFQPSVSMLGLNTVPQDLSLIKQMLVNGHILNFGTCINSWVVGTVKADPASPSNPYAGQRVAIWQNGTLGTHAMTIVGYDDTIWVDINGNGVVDEGEKGAFLVANQWGTGYANKGYIWVAYDAFLSTSAVVNGPSLNRIPLANVTGSYVAMSVPLAANYAPKVIAEFSLTQTQRNQISVTMGVSDQSGTVPTKTTTCYALLKQGGAHEFDGTDSTVPQTAVFAADFTDLLPAVDGTPQRYYLTVSDTTTANPTTLNSFTLIDMKGSKSVNCTMTPVSCDRSSATVYVDYTYGTITPPPTPPTIQITSPKNNSRHKPRSTFTVTAAAQDAVGVDKVEFFVDNVLLLVDTTVPYQAVIESRTLTTGQHTVTAVATNKSGLTASASINFTVGRE